MADSRAPYRISLLQQAREDLEAILDTAARLGIGDRVKAELRAIEQRLRDDPTGWGDPIGRVRSLDLLIHRGIDSQISVQYAVHQAQPIVFVQSFKPILSHPLAGQG